MYTEQYSPPWTPPRVERYPWFALKVKANREAVVAAALRGRGYEGFVPTYPRRGRTLDRSKETRLPLLPGYVFGRFDWRNRLPILTIPGVVHIVGVQNIPLAIDDVEIAALQAVQRSGAPAEPWPFLRVGDRLVLAAGPLRGMEGLLVSSKNDYRLVISVTLLQRSIAVEIDRSWAIPAEKTLHGRQPALALHAPAA